MSLVLNVEILGEFKKLTTATQGAQSSLQKLQDGVGGIAKGIARTVGALAVTLGFTGIVQGFKSAVQAAEEAAVANQRIDAIAESMDEFGLSTEKVTKRIKDFADANEFSLGVDGDVIKATQAKLLTFRELTKTADVMGGSFDRATVAALDMAAAGFGEATSNATQLGKALNDPIAGITALNRSGIQFTEDQKKLIKSLVDSGDMLKAQDIILREVEAQVGGTSAATATASEKMTIAFGAISEEVGKILLPIVGDFSQWLVDSVPKIQKFYDELMDPTTEMGQKWQGMIGVLKNTGEQFDILLGKFGQKPSEGGIMDWVTTLSAGLGQIVFFLNYVADSIGRLSQGKFGEQLTAAFNYGKSYEEFVRQQNLSLMPAVPGSTTSGTRPNTNIVNNIQVKTDATAQEIANAINRANKASGTNLIRNFQ
jgi:hypothetical protein